MTQIAFSIAAWSACAPRLPDEAAWRQWLAEPNGWDKLPPWEPDLGFLPALQRRRLSPLARLVFAAAWPLLAGQETMPVVFASRDGELNRSFALLQELVAQGQMSPTSFGLSVHNAMVGQWGMLRSDMSETTALAATDDGLELALLEAALLLHEGLPEVLVVVADEPLDTGYDVAIDRAPFAHALALRLRAGNEWTLAATPRAVGQSIDPPWAALHFIRHQYAASPQWQRHSPQQSWTWTRTRHA